MSTLKKTPSRKPRDYHHGELRPSLVKIAGELLEQEGAEALSLRDVARRAEVSHNAPYRHFADRDALLAAVAADGFRALGAAIRDSDGRARIGEAYVAFALAHPRLFALMFSNALRPADHPELAEAMSAAFAAYAGSDFADETKGDPRPRLIAAWSMVHGLAHLLIADRLGPNLLAAAPDLPSLTRKVLDAFRG